MKHPKNRPIGRTEDLIQLAIESINGLRKWAKAIPSDTKPPNGYRSWYHYKTSLRLYLRLDPIIDTFKLEGKNAAAQRIERSIRRLITTSDTNSDANDVIYGVADENNFKYRPSWFDLFEAKFL